MNIPSKFVGRTIAKSVYESLHIGLQRMGKIWGWKIVDDEKIEEESNPITRKELGLIETAEEKTGNTLLREDSEAMGDEEWDEDGEGDTD